MRLLILTTAKIYQLNTYNKVNGLWSCRFSAFHNHHSKEICQSFENCNEHVRNGLGTITTRSSSLQQLDRVKWICFLSCWSSFFIAVTIFYAVMWSLRFPFLWSYVCHYMWFTAQRTRPVNIDHNTHCSDMNTHVEEFIFSSERPKINSSWYEKKRAVTVVE